MVRTGRRVAVVDNRPLARQIGERVRRARLNAGMTQRTLAEGRYTPSYISALERGQAKPSMAALVFISERLGVPTTQFLGGLERSTRRIEADVALAAGDLQRALDVYQELLDSVVVPGERAAVLRSIAEALCRLGRGEEAIGPATEAAELMRAESREADAVEAEYWLAYANFLQDNTTEARVVLGRILIQVRAGLEVLPDFKFRVLMGIANVEMREGEYGQARTYMEQARVLTADLDIRRRATLLSGLALTYREAGDLEASVVAGVKSLALYRAAEAERDEALLSNNLALTYLRLNNFDRAAELLSSARGWGERNRDEFLLAHVAESEAQLAVARGRPDEARTILQRAIALAEASGNQQALASSHQTAARLALDAGDSDAAAGSLRQALEVLRAHGPAARLRDVLASLGDVERARGRVVVAADLYREALETRR